MLIKKEEDMNEKVETVIDSIKKIDFQLITETNIWFVLSGYLEIMRNGSAILIRTGDIFILNKGDMVRVIDAKDNQTLTMKLYQNKLPPFKLSLPLSMVYKKDAYQLIKDCIAYLYMEKKSNEAGSSYMVESYFQRLIGLLYRYLQPIEEGSTQILSDKVREVVSYINENYANKLTLDKIAEQSFSSKYYLSHTFKEQLGITIGNYIKEVRLFHSIRMLERTNEKIVTIALSNGFPSLRSFNEAFKSRFHHTPAAFRKKRRREKEQHLVDESKHEDVIELLSPYVSVDEYLGTSSYYHEQLKVEINPKQLQAKFPKVNHVLKVKPYHIDSRLIEVNRSLGIKWVAVTHIIKKINMHYKNGNLTYSYRELDQLLQQIISAGMKPYIQFQTVDFDEWQSNIDEHDNLFQDLIAELKYHLQQNFSSTNEWVYEFRCFYEFENSGSLCTPLAESISIFKGYSNIVIHFPKRPEDSVLMDLNEMDCVYCIDDYAFIRKISFANALNHLNDESNIKAISEHNNFEDQISILDRMLAVENDEYHQKYTDLVQANAFIWQNMRQIIETDDMASLFPPISLDTENLFEYFPEELAGKLSLCTIDGRLKENWYATAFLNQLYEEIIFQNEACIVTKWQENYRILTVYPEEELIYIFKQEGNKVFNSNRRIAKSPHLSVELKMQNVVGTYRLVKQELTTDLVDRRTDIEELRKCKKLSYDDIAYWNAINRPLRTIETLEIRENNTIRFDVPLFGIIMIELEKVSE
ncbi:helix-turn-helix transcriptional regulator [Gracilibacillus sp. HCP3S3_G5_1]|uniref:helix-turn-helix transcriptional regulator n=1 Tax=unclassified Gracilibacillus TaxID=2625209 RepID=UPI003F8A1238